LPPVGSGFTGRLRVGEIANTASGPYLGVDYGGGAETTYLVTALDLDAMPQAVAITPERLVDTRNPNLRSGILRSSADAFDSAGRLRSGAYMDVAVDTADADFTLEAAFLNLLSTGALGSGFLTAYPPGTRPLASTLNYTRGLNLANGSFVALGTVTVADSSFFAVRIYSSGTTHVVIDLNGAVVIFAAPSEVMAQRKAGGRASSTERFQKARTRR